jgi:RimJ/RimL family protein N-acetyltransferase
VKRDLGDGYEVDDDRSRIDVAAVHRYLSEDSYWAKGRGLEKQQQLVDGAERVVGLYHHGTQIGFCRAASSDGISFAYLADVYVLPEHRGRGLGKELVAEMVDRGPLAERIWLLHTADAHALYRQFGFGTPGVRLMERRPVTPETEPVLTDEVVELRPWRDSDAGALAGMDDYSAEIEHFDRREPQRWIDDQRRFRASGRGWSFAIVERASGEVAGGIGMAHRQPPGTAEPGYWLLPDHRGKGLATRATLLICEWAFAEHGVARIQASVEPWNEASQRVLERAGFQREGLLRSYASWRGSRQDVYLYAVLPGELSRSTSHESASG